MQPEMAKEKPKEEESAVGPCLNPAIGEKEIVAYITDDLTEAEREDFVNHLNSCKFCLKEIVLWRTAEELAEREERPLQVTRTA